MPLVNIYAVYHILPNCIVEIFKISQEWKCFQCAILKENDWTIHKTYFMMESLCDSEAHADIFFAGKFDCTLHVLVLKSVFYLLDINKIKKA